MSDCFLKVSDAAKAMSCTEATVRRMVNSGLIQFIEVGVGERKSIRVKLPDPIVKSKDTTRKVNSYVGSILKRR